MASIIDDIARPDYSMGDNAEMGAGIGAGVRSDMDGPDGAEGKVDITMLDKTNKTLILVSY